MLNPNFNASTVDGWMIAWGAPSTCIPIPGNEDYILSVLNTIPNLVAYRNDTIQDERSDWFSVVLPSMH